MQDLNQLVRDKKLSIVFLLEIKILKGRVKRVKCRIGFANYFLVNPIGRSGGLSMLWNEDVTLVIVNYSNYHIHSRIHGLCNDDGYFLTRLYG